ncbi:hypothetical protein FRC17_001988 [Serendipita sp. 399]|nr:hypothetical protein FRC17_001988 [Serendipita sp. 399]
MTQPRSLAKDPPMEIEWFINCIYETQIFTVPINSTNSVGQLQRVIIKQEFDIFKNVPAARLDLYLVNVKGSRREVIQAAQETIRNLESDDALNPIHRLAGIFPDGPPLDSLHIIIQVSDPTTLNKEHSPRRFLDDVTIAITNFVAHDAEPIISGFLNNPSPSVWRPPNGVDQDITDFYQSLEIPMRNVNEPDLLLHSLWKLAHEPERLKLMVPAAENHLILCNASATGKTRLLLEHLCRSYAFYFVASTGADDIGSNDLPNTIKGLSADPDLQKIDRKKDATVIMSTSSGNGYSASTRILRVFTARWIIFHTFLRVSAEHNNGLLPEMTKYNWMLFQVLPLSHGDLFAQLVERLYGTHDEMLRTILEEHMDQARSLIYGSSNTNDRFHYILDEVQVAGNMHKEYFSDETGRFERSVLRSIIRMLYSFRNTLVILSGTGLDLSELRVVLNPGVGKDSTEARWNRQHDIGDFSSEASQERYLVRYFPKKFLESPSGTAFKERVFEWLRGRRVVMHLFHAALSTLIDTDLLRALSRGS